MKSFSCILVMLLLFTACSKNDVQSNTGNSVCFPAYVRVEDTQASGGTGWVIIREDVRSIPFIVNNLSNDFKVNDLPVNICVEETTEKISCSCSNDGRNYYRIVSIRRR